MNQIHLTPIPTRGAKLTPEQAMELAVREAYKGATRVSPNPLVGAVILDANGGFLACGYHEFYGGPHAEVNALKGLREEDLRGAQVFVTLEPCAHEGKTPSCAKMLSRLPIKKVIFGLIDPNPLVAGQGARLLREAGIETEVFYSSDFSINKLIQTQLEEVCEAFLWNFRHKRVFVALKMASSIDGQIALSTGESQWITGEESRLHVHYLRACFDAVLVGRGTVEADNPSLNIRHPQISKKNKVVVIDGEAQLLGRFGDLKLSKTHEAKDIFWCVATDSRTLAEEQAAQMKSPPTVIFVERHPQGDFNLEDLLAQLFQQGLRSILIEGGAYTASTFLNNKLVNRLYLFQAPIIMGSGGSRSWTETVQLTSMNDKIQLKNPHYFTFGHDFMITGTL